MSTDEAIALPLTVAVTGIDGHLPSPPVPGRRGKNVDILLPKWVYIKDRHGRYLSVRSGPTYSTLTFRTGNPDLNCAFEPIGSGSWYKFHGRNGNYIQRYYVDWYAAEDDGAEIFNVISSTGNYVYLKDEGSYLISNELNATGSPVAHNYINESSRFEIVQAAVKNEIIDVKYDIPGGQALAFSYEKWSVGTWNNSAGAEIGMKTTFQAGIPFVASAEYEISVSGSYSREWGGEEGTKQIISSSTTVTVPPKKKARATVIVRNAQIDVGFTYTQRVLWSNGQSVDLKKTGIYNNVDSWHVDVELDNWEPI